MTLALLGAAAIGISLGLLGSGGSILTIPVLVYLLGHPEKQAIAESLAIVGLIALAGAVRAAIMRKLDWRMLVVFGAPGIVGAAVGATGAKYIAGAVQLAALGVVMLAAAVLMFRPIRAPKDGVAKRPHPVLLLGEGFGVGALTGVLGVGGGFVAVPALVLLGGLDMGMAVGTSLGIIALNCASGLTKTLWTDAAHAVLIDWRTVAIVSAVGIAGALGGAALQGRIPQKTLRKVFAVFLVMMAGYIIYRQAGRL